MGGANSKQTFSELIHVLLEKEIDTNDHEFWDELWKTVLTIEEIFEVIKPEDIRRMVDSQPGNVRTIFTQAVAQLYQVIQTPYPIYFQQALNCTRVLCRILPFLLEASDSKFVKELLWSRRMVRSATATEDEGERDENAERDAPSDEDKPKNLSESDKAHKPSDPTLPVEGSETKTAPGEAPEHQEPLAKTKNIREDSPPGEFQESEPLAVILVNTIYHLLFLPDFTIEDPNVDFNENDVDTPQFKSALVWAPGVGSSEKTVVTSTQFDTSRVEILRLLIAAFSDSLFQVADSYDSCASMWLEVATSAEAPYAEIVFYSLINTVLGYDPIGWGVPYGNLMSTDTAKSVMECAVQALIIVLDYGHPIKYDSGAAPLGNLPFVLPNDTDAQGFNVFRRLLGRVEDPDQLNFVFRGFVRLLSNVPQSESTYLPYSVTRIGIEQELLILLWKCLEEMPSFLPYVLQCCDVTELLVPVCYFMLEGRKDASKVGLMYLCTFTLLKLSGERDFGVALNKPYQLDLPVDVPLFRGNHADLLVIVLQKMIVSGLEKLSPLYSCFLTIICNVSPYTKTLCTVAAVKLVNLFQLFVSPRFLYAAEGNHVYVSLLLETFNNIVQYQYEGNGNLVFAIVRRRELFDGLAHLTLPSAIQNAHELGEKNKNNNKNKDKDAKSKKKKESASATMTRTEDEHGEVFPDAQPTELISTQNLERQVQAGGEVVDVQSPAAECRAPSTPSRTKPEDLPAVKSQVQQLHQLHTAGNARFVPTEEWLKAVKSDLPLNTITRLIKHLTPQIEQLARKQAIDEQHVVSFLKSTTLVGLLPVPHPIVIRKYQPNKYTCLWFTAFQWGVIFMHNQALPLLDGKYVKLFVVQTA